MRNALALLALTFVSPAFAASPAPPSAAGQSGEPRSLVGVGETTDWMGTVVAEEMARQFRKAGRAMTAIECRNNSDLDVDSGEGTQFRFTSAENDARIEWTWREFSSPDMKTVDRKLNGEGYRLVAHQDFVRQPSGQKRTCALWQK